MTAAPNTFQCHNVYIDRAMELLTDAEFRLLIFATRHIMGWQDSQKERQNEISVTMFERGFTTKKGKKFGGCGLSRSTITKTLKSLAKYGFLEAVGDAGNDGQRWELHDGDIDWDALEQRKADKSKAAKKQTAKAAKASQEKRQRTSTSNVPPEQGSTSNVPLGSTSNVPETPKGSTSNVLKQTQESKPNNKPNKDSSPTGDTDFAITHRQKTDLIKAWWDNTPELNRPIQVKQAKMYTYKGFISAAEEAIKRGITPEKMAAYVKHETSPHGIYHDKPLKFGTAAERAPAWCAVHYRPPAQSLSPDDPDPPLPPGMLSADPELDQILKSFGETMSDTKRLNKVKDSA